MKKTREEKITLSIAFAVFLAYSVSLVFPFLWALFNSFKANFEFFQNVWALPDKWLFGNYGNVFKEFNMGSMFIVSIITTAGGVIVSITAACLPAYVVSRYRFRGGKVIYTIAITVMLIPTTGSLAALYKLMNTTRLYNSFPGLFLLYAGGFGFNFLLLYGFFKNIPWSYAEAAMVDGAGHFKTFYRIMLPQARNALIAIGIIAAINMWNDFFTPFMFLPKHPTLATGMQRIVSDMTYASDWPKLFAAMVICTLPTIITFAIFQKTIIENTVAGGLKG